VESNKRKLKINYFVVPTVREFKLFYKASTIYAVPTICIIYSIEAAWECFSRLSHRSID